MFQLFLRINYFIFLIVFCFGINCIAAFAQSTELPPCNRVNGIWADSNSTAFANGYAIFSVDSLGKLAVAHYVEFNNVPMVENGLGWCRNNTLSYDVLVTKAIPGWSIIGKHELTLSEDGNTLRGYYKDSKDNTGPLVFKRLYK